MYDSGVPVDDSPPLGFQWDREKARRNLAKHGLSFKEGAEAVDSEGPIERLDADHSEEEERWLLLGTTESDRLVVVSYTMRGDDVRIISVRSPTRQERDAFGQRR